MIAQSPVAALRSTPNSSTKLQHQTLVIAASRKGIDLHELRKMVGGSLRRLSAAECSAWIERLSGKGLHHPPGQAPPAYPRRRSHSTVTCSPSQRSNSPRIITASHIDQIMRLMSDYFGGNQPAASAWFKKCWKCDDPRLLGTTERAGKVIAALKRMLRRRGLKA